MSSFAHLSDIHVGAFRNPVLQELAFNAFAEAMDICIKRRVDFIIIAGDLFDSNIPDLAIANKVVQKIVEIRKEGIGFYVVYGSHDFSPTQTSIIDLLESAGLFTKVTKGRMVNGKLQLEFKTDEKTNAKLCGISGRKLGIEKEYYNVLDREPLEKEEGFKIFIVHGTVSEYKPEYAAESESVPISSLPRNFNYFAGGHVHEKVLGKEYGQVVAYPGTLFGADYRDLEVTAKGQERGFFIINFSTKLDGVEFVPVSVCQNELLEYDANNKTAATVQEDLLQIGKTPHSGGLVLLKVAGEMSAGKTSDVDFQRIRRAFKENGAIEALLNYYKLTSREYAAIRVATIGEEVHKIEERLFKENIGTVSVTSPKLKGDPGVKLSQELLKVLRQSKKENETKGSYETRVSDSAIETLDLKEALGE